MKNITMKLQGGLGNQMFQYAFAKALSLRNSIDFTLDISSYKTYFRKYELDIFAIQNFYATIDAIPFYEKIFSHNKYMDFLLIKYKGICKKINPNHFVEKKFNFYPPALGIKSGYIEGCFQSEKYFIDYEDEIKKDFTFIVSPSTKNKEMANIISGSNAVSIHIRRGDYVSNPANNFYNVCDIDYYKKAIAYIKQRVKSPVFFFFSDDMPWVKENFTPEDPVYYIDFNADQTNYEDMRLMSLCKHNIIANSSFSRWGAWLNANPSKIVLAPNRRFSDGKLDYSDVVPTSWVKI